jgi:hypothetical protein
VGVHTFPETSGSYEGQLVAGDEFGFLTKFANAVWRLCESSTSAEVAVDLLNVPKRMGTSTKMAKETLFHNNGTWMTYILTRATPPNWGRTQAENRGMLHLYA